MPGAIAHMAAVRQAQARLVAEYGATLIAECADQHPAWLHAGSIAPDYSDLYQILSRGHPDKWSCLLHQEKSGDAIRAGVAWINDHIKGRSSPEFQRSVAWLAGYLSHIVLDATIHPVVHAIVGEYNQHRIDHQHCEMVMDAYICNRYGSFAEMMADWEAVLSKTSDEAGKGMDPTIKSIWSYMLKKTYPAAYEDNPPAFDAWQRDYLQSIPGACLEEVFFRHAAPGTTHHYLARGKLPKDASLIYIENCLAPENNRFGRETMHLDEVFRFGIGNVVHYWLQLEEALGSGDAALPELPNWNLDHGRLDSHTGGDAALWI